VRLLRGYNLISLENSSSKTQILAKKVVYLGQIRVINLKSIVAEANKKGMNYITRLLFPAQKFITTTRSPSRQNSPTKVKSQNVSPSMMSSEFSPDKRVYLVDGIMMSPESKLLKEEQDKYVALSFGPHQLTEEPENLSSDIEKKEVSIEMQEFQFRFEEWLINSN